MSITAVVVNDSIKLPMHVPDGTRVEIVLPEVPTRRQGKVAPLQTYRVGLKPAYRGVSMNQLFDQLEAGELLKESGQ